MTKKQRIERARKAGKAGAGIPRGDAPRRNGRLGGRPGNPEIKRIMRERGVSRQRAHQLFHAE